jgi:Bacterial pre-peptidase C-terminal domain
MFRSLSVWTMVASLSLATPLLAQQPQPGLPLGRLDTIFPCGAKAGTTVEVQLAGADLDETESLVFSHPAIKSELIKDKEEPPKVDPKDAKKDQPKRKRDQQSTPGARFRIIVPPDVPVGQYDVRAIHKWGVSNPRAFCVGDLTEVTEKEPNNDDSEAQRIEINSTVNGVIATPTDVDFYVFSGKKGQRVVLSCLTSSIDSKARPMIELFDSSGRRVAFNRNYNANDAVTDAVLEDGDYVVRVSEFTYTQGSPQHFYRLSVSTAPWIDAVFPPMVESGKPAQVTLYGRNLPGGVPEPGAFVDGRPLEKLAVTINPPADPLAAQRLSFKGRIEPRSAGIDGFEYRIKGPDGFSNPALISFASAKVVLEKEPNDKPEEAQDIPVPCEVAGRIDKRQDRDWFAFNAKKGEVYSIELFSERLGVPTDLYFTFKKDKATNEIEEDDNPEILNLQQFYSRTSDPQTHRFTANEDGRYLIGVGSRESSFLYGPRIVYRLRVTPEKPDFRLVVMPGTNYQPETTVLNADGNQYLDVFVFRNDGFNDPITLSAEGLPEGVTCPPALIGTGQKQGVLVLSADEEAPAFNGAFTVKGTAIINGQKVVREARSATITWGVQPQQNIPTVARLDQGLYLAVRDNARFKITLELEKAFVKMGEKMGQPILLKPNEKLTVPFKITRQGDNKTPITLQQVGLGANPQQSLITVNNGQPLAPIAADKNDGNFVIDLKPNITPGTYSVTLKATTPIQFTKDPATKKTQNATIAEATTSVIFKVLPVSVAKVSASAKSNFKPGVDGEIIVKVERQGDYARDFKVKVVLPPNTKGISVGEATIPVDKNEVVIPVKVAADAVAGNLQNVVVQATTLVEGRAPYTVETKFTIAVDKPVEKPADKPVEKPVDKAAKDKKDKK